MIYTQHRMISVPVTIQFDSQCIVGVLTIDKTKLPSTSDFVFSIGYMSLDPIEANKPYTGSYTLKEVSLVPDEMYINYLRQTGKL